MRDKTNTHSQAVPSAAELLSKDISLLIHQNPTLKKKKNPTLDIKGKNVGADISESTSQGALTVTWHPKRGSQAGATVSPSIEQNKTA